MISSVFSKLNRHEWHHNVIGASLEPRESLMEKLENGSQAPSECFINSRLDRFLGASSPVMSPRKHNPFLKKEGPLTVDE